MNQRIYKRCLEVAKAMKPRVQNGKSYHVCYLIRKGKVICIGTNDYTKTHNVKRFGKYENWKGFESEYRPCIHAEISTLIRNGETDLSNYEVLNVRIDNNNNANMSLPCPNCFRILSSLDGPPRKVFYSDAEGNLQQDERF